MSGAAKRARIWKGLWAPLALLALLVNVLIPNGYMAAAGPAGPTLVICTGHGPAALAGGDQPTRPADKSGHASVCAFAGHGLASAPPPIDPGVRVVFRFETAPGLAAPDLSPGRGLAAPPPPSRGPPTLV